MPSPIGSTEIFFPGIWKAAAALEDGVAPELSAAADMPLLLEGLLAAPFDVDADGGGDGDGVLVGAGLGTEENPYGEKLGHRTHTTTVRVCDRLTTTDTPGFVGLVEAGGGEEVGDDRGFYAAVNKRIGGRKQGGLTVEVAVLVEEDSDCVLDDCTPRTTVHCRTTCTIGSPFFPTTGVNVTVHVSVARPAGLQQQPDRESAYTRDYPPKHTNVLIVCTV